MVANPLRLTMLLLLMKTSLRKVKIDHEIGDIRITPQQYHILSYIFKQIINNYKLNQAQVNQVGSFSIKSTKHVSDLSPTGNIFSFGNLETIKHLWILDSSATNQVCISLSKFSSYHCIKPFFKSLPNGHTISAYDSGTTHFMYKFYLTNVFYVP